MSEQAASPAPKSPLLAGPSRHGTLFSEPMRVETIRESLSNHPRYMSVMGAQKDPHEQPLTLPDELKTQLNIPAFVLNRGPCSGGSRR